MIRRDVGVLGQAQQIDAAVDRFKGDCFSPDLVGTFHALSAIESFWLDGVGHGFRCDGVQ